MKEIILVARPNGSGKTTIVKQLLKDFRLPFVNVDEIYAELPTQEKSQALAGRRALNILKKHLLAKESFILESTLSGVTLLTILSEAVKSGYNINLIYIFIEEVVLLNSRISLRVQKGGHFIEPEIVQRRYSRSLIYFWLMYRIVAHEWTVHNNSFDRNDIICFGEFADATIMDKEVYAQLIARVEYEKANLRIIV